MKRKTNPGKAKRIERRVSSASKSSNHKRIGPKVRAMKKNSPRTYYSWRNRRRKNGR